MSQGPTPPPGDSAPGDPNWSAGEPAAPYGGQTTAPPTGPAWDPGPAPAYEVPGYQPLNAPTPTGPYGPPPGVYPAIPVMVQSPPVNGLAVASMVCGILNWFLLPGIAAILAVIFGHVARAQIRRNGEGGNGMAIAGLILGWIGVGLALVGVVTAVIVGVAVRAAISAAGAGG